MWGWNKKNKHSLALLFLCELALSHCPLLRSKCESRHDTDRLWAKWLAEREQKLCFQSHRWVVKSASTWYNVWYMYIKMGGSCWLWDCVEKYSQIGKDGARVEVYYQNCCVSMFRGGGRGSLYFLWTMSAFCKMFFPLNLKVVCLSSPPLPSPPFPLSEHPSLPSLPQSMLHVTVPPADYDHCTYIFFN